MSINPLQGGSPAGQSTGQSAKTSNYENQQIKSIAKESLPRPVQENKSRCWKCKKKAGLLPIECRCGYVFCMKHRYASSHACDFDYRKESREKLKKENPVVVADKIKNRI